VLLFTVLLTVLNQGCTPYSAPIVDLDQPPSQIIETHLVEQGETLYSIAWRYDFDVKHLARINRLGEPYHLHQGQVLNLDADSEVVSKSAVRGQQAKEATPKVIDRSGAKQKKSPVGSTMTKLSSKKLHWQKPVKGKIAEPYNPKYLRKGIVFKAVDGASVKPAAQGLVVYAGDGLRDYGKLVIIKHSDYLLSAYGHNQRLLVKEGQVVDGSKIISKLGSSGRLYFEIRKDGKPINPMAYIK